MKNSRVREHVAYLVATQFLLIVLVAPLLHLHEPGGARPDDGRAARAATTAPAGAACPVCHWSENLEVPLALPASVHAGPLLAPPVPRVPSRPDSSPVTLPFPRGPPTLLPFPA